MPMNNVTQLIRTFSRQDDGFYADEREYEIGTEFSSFCFEA
jgi:hypothetical protein